VQTGCKFFGEGICKPFNALLNGKKLLNEISEFKPDYVFFSGGSSSWIPQKYLKKICREHFTVLFNGMDFDFAAKRDKCAVKEYKLVITNDQKSVKAWKSLGAKNALALPISACDPSLHKPDENVSKDIEVSFVGSLRPLSLFSRRVAWLERVIKAGVRVKIFTPGPAHMIPSKEIRNCHAGSVSAENMVDVYRRSKITLHVPGCRYGLEGALRLFEASAAGALIVCEKESFLPEWFEEGKEIISVSSPEKAVEKITFLLKDSEQISKIAEKGLRRTQAEHTYQARFQKLMMYLEKLTTQKC